MTETLQEHVQPKETFVRPSGDALIRCEGIEKWYGSVYALSGVDFHSERARSWAWSATTAPASRR